MKKMTKAMLMTALICGTMYCGAEPVHANELDTFTLDEYVVTAARTETKLVDTPANITVITAEQIESRHYTDVAEVMKDVPGANVLDGGTGAGEKAIFLNGDERVLVLVDGRRVSIDLGTMTGRASYDSNQLPDISLIERIEVLKGAGSALYGSDAVGGVINVITKKAESNFGKVSLAYGSNGAEDINAMYSFKKGKTGVSVSASKYKQDYYKYRDYKADKTNRWPCPSDFENEKVSLKIDHQINDDSSLLVGYDYSKFEGCAPGSLRYAKDYWAPVNKSTDNIYARYDWTLNNRDKGYFQFYHNEYEYFNTGGMEEKTNGLDVQQAITLNEKNTMVIGASWRKADVETTPVEKGNNEYDESINNVSFFINDNWEFAPTWTLNTGVRYDKHSEAGSETTLSTGINKKINDKSHAYINWGQVFKAPSTDDLFYNNVNQGNFGNPNLKAETGETWTIGYETSLNNKTDFGINYFQSDLKDAIDWLGTDWYEHPQWGGYYTKYYAENIDEQEKKGMELTLNHRLNDNLDLMASYTYVQVKNNIKNQGAIKDYNYMPNTYRLGINYHDGKWDSNIWLRAGSGGSTSLNTVYAYGGDKTGSSISYLDSDYLTIDLAVTYKAAKDFKIFAKAYNILNEAYVEQAGVYNGTYNQPAQARRFLIGAEYSF